MSLLNTLLSKSKKAELGHGIHEDCVITEATVTGRPGKAGEASKWNCVTKFCKLDADNNVIGEREVSWYDLDNNNEFVAGKFTSQMTQLTNVLECFYTKEEVNAIFDPILADFDITIEGGEESRDEILKDKENCKNLMIDIAKAYVKALVPHLNSTPLRLKLTYDSKGKYVGQPQYNEFVELMSVPVAETKLRFQKNEVENELKSRNIITSGPSKATLSGI